MKEYISEAANLLDLSNPPVDTRLESVEELGVLHDLAKVSHLGLSVSLRSLLDLL